jgi:cysteine desulfurase
LKEAVPDAVILGANAPRLANTSNVALPGLAAENMVIALDLDGVMVSSGSSCSSGKIAASHVLAAMGKGDLSSIRVSFGWNSRSEDADAVMASLVKLWQRARPRAAA